MTVLASRGTPCLAARHRHERSQARGGQEGVGDDGGCEPGENAGAAEPEECSGRAVVVFERPDVVLKSPNQPPHRLRVGRERLASFPRRGYKSRRAKPAAARKPSMAR
jgi:hypothetical protein